MRRMDVVRRTLGSRTAYIDLVHERLYANLDGVGGYDSSILQRRMLIAIGALVMSSVRGSVTDVLTLNFDDVLEWYLDLHGFKTQVVSSLPELVSGRTDVRILHFHGFLPLSERRQRSDWLILTHDELIGRLAEPTAPWPVAIGSLVQSKVLVVIGTSMRDTDLDVIFRRAGQFIGGARPIGYVLDLNIGADQAMALKEWGFVSVSFEDYDEIPEFLLSVCQRAAADSSHSVLMKR